MDWPRRLAVTWCPWPIRLLAFLPGNPAVTRSMGGRWSSSCPSTALCCWSCWTSSLQSIHPARRRLDQRRSSLLPATNSTHPSPDVNKQTPRLFSQPKPAISPFCITATHRPVHLIKNSRCRVRQVRAWVQPAPGLPAPPTYWSSPKLSSCYDVGAMANIHPPRQAALATTGTLQSSLSREDCTKLVCLHRPVRMAHHDPRPSTPLRPLYDPISDTETQRQPMTMD